MFGYSQLECFVAVADTLHFGQAATKLGMTQPPLSRQIQLLEREIGVTLLERSSRSVRLTPAGRVFLPEARRILRLSESAMRWTRRVWRGQSGTLRIGFTAASGYRMLPDLVRHIAPRMPDVDIVLREMISTAQVEALDSGVLDVGFIRPPTDPRRCASRLFLSEPFMAAIPSDYSIATKNVMTIADLDEQKFIAYSPDAARYFHDLLRAALEPAGIKPDIVYQVGQMHSMLALVDAGLGVALIPASATRLRFPNVRFVPIADGELPNAQLYMVWKENSENAVMDSFHRYMAQEYSGLSLA